VHIYWQLFVREAITSVPKVGSVLTQGSFLVGGLSGHEVACLRASAPRPSLAARLPHLIRRVLSVSSELAEVGVGRAGPLHLHGALSHLLPVDLVQRHLQLAAFDRVCPHHWHMLLDRRIRSFHLILVLVVLRLLLPS